MLRHPFISRHTVVQTARVGRHFWYRGGAEGVAEIDHDNTEVLCRDHFPPGAVIGIKSRENGHTPTMNIINAGQYLIGIGANNLQVNRVAIGVRCQRFRGNSQSL